MDSIGLFDVDHLNVARFQAQAEGRCKRPTLSAEWICNTQLSVMSSLDPLRIQNNVGIAMINHPFLMVGIPPSKMVIRGWFIIAIPTLDPHRTSV